MGGRHRDSAGMRRRMFLGIILAFGLIAASISLWALDSPLDETSTVAGDAPGEGAAETTAAQALPDLRVGEASIQSQDAEEAPTTEAATEEPEPEPEPDGDADSDGDSDSGSGPDEPEPDRSTEQTVVDMVNDERSKAGCGALEGNADLDDAARLHAEDMAANDYFSHTSQDGRTPTDRAAEQGYQGGVGENIAAGYPDAASVMEGWMNSDGHRANILNCDYSHIGVGIADRDGTLYWVQNFG